jgi:2-polyprenyl-3-methyl-5-hydroxy-6-metoxy-1,4-benzoquinol methylase
VPADARRILDVGCASGGFGVALREADPDRVVWGIEADPQAAAVAADRYHRVVTGLFPDALAGLDVTFDCLVFNDVLEHLADPWTALRDGLRHLEPGGAVVVSIPNIRYVGTVVDLVLRGNWAYADRGVLDRTHLRFFTRRTAVELVAGAGLTVEKVKGINWFGQRWRWPKLPPKVLRDFAYTGFLVIGRKPAATAAPPPPI